MKKKKKTAHLFDRCFLLPLLLEALNCSLCKRCVRFLGRLKPGRQGGQEKCAASILKISRFSFLCFQLFHLVLPSSKLVPDWALTHSVSWLAWRHMDSSSSSIHSSICYYYCCYNSFVHGDGQMRVTSATEVRVKDWLSCTWKSLSQQQPITDSQSDSQGKKEKEQEMRKADLCRRIVSSTSASRSQCLTSCRWAEMNWKKEVREGDIDRTGR